MTTNKNNEHTTTTTTTTTNNNNNDNDNNNNNNDNSNRSNSKHNASGNKIFPPRARRSSSFRLTVPGHQSYSKVIYVLTATLNNYTFL